MSGLIWGYLRLDDGQAAETDIDGLTRAIAEASSIGHISRLSKGPVVCAQANLRPHGSTQSSEVQSTSLGSGEVFVSDVSTCGSLENSYLKENARIVSALRSAEYDNLINCGGDFSAAYWSEHSRKLVLCRDPFGVRPLYYVHIPNEAVFFSSLSEPLAKVALRDATPNIRSVIKLGAWNFDTAEETFVEGLYRVPAAHIVELSATRTRLHQYWQLTPGAPLGKARDRSSVFRELRTHVEHAVEKRLPVNGEIVTHCSGGLDSSAITAIASDHAEKSGQSVTGCFVEASGRDDVSIVDGGPFTASLAQQRPNLAIARFKPMDIDTALFGDLRLDRPQAASISDNHWVKIFEFAGARGVPVVLSGFGGDETVSPRGHGAAIEALLRINLREFIEIIAARSASDRVSRSYILFSELSRAVLPNAWVRRLRQRFGKSKDYHAILESYISEDARGMMPRTRPDPVTATAKRLRRLTDGRLAANAEILAEDAARYGVSVAFPFLDRQVVEFSLRIPPKFLFGDGFDRWPLRAIMENKLPEMIRFRRKKIPADNASILNLSERKSELLASLSNFPNPESNQCFDLSKIRDAIEALPSPEESREDIEKHAHEGEQPEVSRATFIIPYILARFIRETKRD